MKKVAKKRAPSPMIDQAQDAYFVRMCALKTLGYKTYKAYLKSPLWERIRLQVLAGGSARCHGCGALATQVHHGRYNLEDLDGRCFAHLYPVCYPCHKYAEFTKRGTKTDPATATQRLTERPQTHPIVSQANDSRARWSHFFTATEAMRAYLGMEASEEARALVEQWDAARMNLPEQSRAARKQTKQRR